MINDKYNKIRVTIYKREINSSVLFIYNKHYVRIYKDKVHEIEIKNEREFTNMA